MERTKRAKSTKGSSKVKATRVLAAISLLGTSLGMMRAEADTGQGTGTAPNAAQEQAPGLGQKAPLKGDSRQLKLDSQQLKLDSQQHKLDSRQLKLDSRQDKWTPKGTGASGSGFTAQKKGAVQLNPQPLPPGMKRAPGEQQ